MARQQPGLRLPGPGDVHRVPSTSRRRRLWRACGRTYPQPWFFSSRDTARDPGRFDLRSDDGGTCYWAVSAAAAVIEAVADPDAPEPPLLTLAGLANLSVWSAAHVPAARRRRLADTTVAALPALTGELATIVPYDIPWAWADAFHADGRTGICYRGRFSHDDSLALFGPAGIPPDLPGTARHPASDFYDALPIGFRQGVGTVGDFGTLPRGAPPGSPSVAPGA